MASTSRLKAHERTVDLLEKEISSGQDADAKAFAQSVLPTVKHHLEAARTLASEAGVKNASRFRSCGRTACATPPWRARECDGAPR